MSTNNKGSVLVCTLIIFSIVIMISFNEINMTKANSEIIHLEKEEFLLEEKSLSYLELIISNIANQIDSKINLFSNEEEFYDYFTSKSFISSISYNDKNISTEIKYTKNTDEINYKIETTYKENDIYKSTTCSLEIKNPFTLTTNSTIYTSKDLIKIHNYKEN